MSQETENFGRGFGDGAAGRPYEKNLTKQYLRGYCAGQTAFREAMIAERDRLGEPLTSEAQ